MNCFGQRFLHLTALILVSLALLPEPRLVAADAAAEKYYMQGHELYKQNKFRDAAGKFESAFGEATSGAIRANALLAQIAAWRMCDLMYKEFLAIERLLKEYPEYAGDFASMVSREYELAREFCRGKRDPAFWHLRWIPWLVDSDKSIEIYQTALARAPFAKEAPEARLHLAHLYQEEGRVRDSMNQLRLLLKEHPDSKLCRYAALSLANALFELSKRGDGDGRYIREAAELLNDFRKHYPDATEKDWAERKIVESQDIQAERLFEMAKYYRKQGKSDAANRYLARVVREYPSSKVAIKSEKELAERDNTFVPGDFPANPGPRLPEFQVYELPPEITETLIMPGVNDNHFLLPVPDLHIK